MKKRGRGRPPKLSHFNQNPHPHPHPDFFQVFLPDHHSHQLRIPPDFVKHFSREVPEAVILRDLSGQTWKVDIKQEPNGVFLTNGWNQFVKDKFLMLGEFMVFRYYKTTASFTVRIFGLDGCKKDDFDKSTIHVKEEQESESDQESIPIRKRKHPDISPKTPETMAAGRRRKRVKRQVRLEAKDNNVNSKRIPPHKKSRNGSRRAKRREGLKAKEIVFATSISRSKRTKLYIPSEFVKTHKVVVRPREAVTTYNEKRESWLVRILATKDGRSVFSGGWVQFCMDNGIKVGDDIECRFVLGRGRVCKELHVTLFRALRKSLKRN